MLTRNIKQLKTMDQLLEIGCFNTQVIAEKFGIPIMVLSIAQFIDENLKAKLPTYEGREFFAEFVEAIGQDDKDLSLVGWQFLHSALKAMPEQKPDSNGVIDRVIAGTGLLAEGKEWSAAEANAVSDAASDAAGDVDLNAAVEAVADAAAAAAAAATDAVADDAEYGLDGFTYAAAEAVAVATAYSTYASHDVYDVSVVCERQRKTLLSLIEKA